MSALLQQQQAYDAQYDRQQERDEQLEAQCDVLASSLKGDYALDVEHLSDSFGDICNDKDLCQLYLAYRLASGERKHTLGLSLLQMMTDTTDNYLEFIAKRDAVKDLQS